jgi:hypothetical protein
MTRDYSKLFLGALVLLFTVEHIWLVTRPDRLTVDPNPTCTVRIVKP